MFYVKIENSLKEFLLFNVINKILIIKIVKNRKNSGWSKI